jgi:hypothetical protein
LIYIQGIRGGQVGLSSSYVFINLTDSELPPKPAAEVLSKDKELKQKEEIHRMDKIIHSLRVKVPPGFDWVFLPLEFPVAGQSLIRTPTPSPRKTLFLELKLNNSNI